MLLLVLGVVVALGAVALVLEPILRPTAVPPRRPTAPADDDPVLARKNLALAALKEIEFDRATGKLSEEDYERMRARYTAEALEALRATNGGSASPPAVPLPYGPADPVESLIAGAREARRGMRFCTECGAELEGSGRFCVECGARLSA